MLRELSAKNDVKIRKPHLCFACLRRFPVGSKMDVAAYADGGDMYTLYTCTTCSELLHHMEPDWSDEYSEGCVVEEMSMYEGMDTPEALLDYYEHQPRIKAEKGR